MDILALWVCTADGVLVRADKIATISVVDGNGRPARSSGRGDVRIRTELPGGTDGDTRTQHDLAACPAGEAEQVTAGLLQAIFDAAASDGPSPVFIYRDPEEGAWVGSHEMPAGRIVAADPPSWRRPI